MRVFPIGPQKNISHLVKKRGTARYIKRKSKNWKKSNGRLFTKIIGGFPPINCLVPSDEDRCTNCYERTEDHYRYGHHQRGSSCRENRI